VRLTKGSRWSLEWDESNLRHVARHRINRVNFSDESGEDRWYALVLRDSNKRQIQQRQGTASAVPYGRMKMDL
jgi:hypothetical protein